MKSPQSLKQAVSKAESCLWKMSFKAWLCLSSEPSGLQYMGYSSQSSSCPQEQVSWFQASAWSSKAWPISFLHFLWAWPPPCLKRPLLQLHPQFLWTLVPHPNKKAKKHTKYTWAGSRKRWRKMMWLFYSMTSSFTPPFTCADIPAKYWVALSS